MGRAAEGTKRGKRAYRSPELTKRSQLTKVTRGTGQVVTDGRTVHIVGAN